MKKRNINAPIAFRVALFLLVLTVISTSMVGELYAKFTTGAGGIVSGTVAKFSVDAVVEVNEDGAYMLTVTNNSEVTIKYTVYGTVDGNDLPPGVTLTLLMENGAEITDQPLTLAAGGTAELEIKVNEDESVSPHDAFDVQIMVRAEQVD